MKNMRFKAGDRVRIKSIDWYNENKNEFGDVKCSLNCSLTKAMSIHCGSILTVEKVVDGGIYWMEENQFNWADEMIEGLVEEEKPLCEGCCSLELKYNKLTITDNICTDKVEIILQDYELKQEGDKWFAVKKKKEYPKTYEECCYVLGFENTEMCFEGDYRDINPPKEQWKRLGLMNQLNKLLVCRDAYWKIAGEEMELGKPWKPDWREKRYIIYRNQDDIIPGYREAGYVEHHIFEFPTKVMQDAFKENFDPDIEFCKELL